MDEEGQCNVPLVKLRLTGKQHQAVYQHLYSGDGCESVALALCGRTERVIEDKIYELLSVHKLIFIPNESCLHRSPQRVQWSTSILPDLLKEAKKKHLSVLQIHSHPSGYRSFSQYDDIADREVFVSIAEWLDIKYPGISAIMLPDGHMIGRLIDDEGAFSPLESIMIVGDDIRICKEIEQIPTIPEFAHRTKQVFGELTTYLLSQLSVGVVGCSGTGSPVIEMLARNSIGELVLVDPDAVEDKNLNRIYNAILADAQAGRYKVDVLADAVRNMGLGTRVVALAQDLFSTEVIERLSLCDVIFGCVDTVEGRNILNRLCAFYNVPYFDLGVLLEADKRGTIEQVCGAVHYLQPDGSSLLNRGVYTVDELVAESLRRTNPEVYEERRKNNYIRGMENPVERPAVIHINTIIAGLAINEFLGRIHPFREEANNCFLSVIISLSQMRFIFDGEGECNSEILKYVGRGDTQPLLDMPEFSIDNK